MVISLLGFAVIIVVVVAPVVAAAVAAAVVVWTPQVPLSKSCGSTWTPRGPQSRSIRVNTKPLVYEVTHMTKMFGLWAPNRLDNVIEA